MVGQECQQQRKVRRLALAQNLFAFTSGVVFLNQIIGERAFSERPRLVSLRKPSTWRHDRSYCSTSTRCAVALTPRRVPTFTDTLYRPLGRPDRSNERLAGEIGTSLAAGVDVAV